MEYFYSDPRVRILFGILFFGGGMVPCSFKLCFHFASFDIFSVRRFFPKQVMSQFAKHYATNEPLPADILHRLCKSRETVAAAVSPTLRNWEGNTSANRE